MTTNETPRGNGAIAKTTGRQSVASSVRFTPDMAPYHAPATADQVLAGTRAPHELPPILHDLWRDGFIAGQNAASARVARAEREADFWYYQANHGPEIRAHHAALLKAFDVALARKSTMERWAELDRIAAARAAEAVSA